MSTVHILDVLKDEEKIQRLQSQQGLPRFWTANECSLLNISNKEGRINQGEKSQANCEIRLTLTEN